MLRALQRNDAGEPATLGQHRISSPMSGRTPPVIGGPSRTDSAVLPALEPHANLVRTAGGGRGQGPNPPSPHPCGGLQHGFRKQTVPVSNLKLAGLLTEWLATILTGH